MDQSFLTLAMKRLVHWIRLCYYLHDMNKQAQMFVEPECEREFEFYHVLAPHLVGKLLNTVVTP